MKPAVLFILISTCVWAGQTTVRFNPADPDIGPFPSNALTVTDDAQKTGLRVNLPESFNGCEPSASPSVCADPATISLIDQLDGFSINPRVMACFSGPVNTSTLQSGIEIAPVHHGAAITMNQIIFDPITNCAFAKPNRVLLQQTEYLLIVTNAVHDMSGANVARSADFAACLVSSDRYCRALEAALDEVHQPSEKSIVTASLFTTMSATTWLEHARQFTDGNQRSLTNTPLGAFNLLSVQSMTWVPQGSGDDPDNSETISPSSALSGVGQVAFGLFMSPLFLDPTNGSIPQTPTARPIRGTTIYVPVSYHVFLPAKPAPPGGYPVAIYGHGLGDNQFGAPTYIASSLAQYGIATLAFEIVGHGYGPGGVVSVSTSNGVQTVPTPGRGIRLPDTNSIGPSDGCILPGALAVRDCGRQTAIDLFAMMQTIRKTHGLGLGLNESRVFYVGQSFGGTYGTLFHAVEINETVAVLNGAGGTSVDVARLAITGRLLAIGYLASVNFGLLNAVDTDGNPDFNDNYVFRDLPPVTNNVDGAMAIQAAFEAADWLGMVGDPLAFAVHLKTSPLAGVPPKSTLFQFGYGDLEVPNPTESAVVRAANAQSNTSFFRFNKAASIDSNLPFISMPPAAPFRILPHRLLSNPTIVDNPDEDELSIAQQSQAAAFFISNGASIKDADSFLTGAFAGANLFETPPASLPTRLNF